MIGRWSSVTRSTDLIGVKGAEWAVTPEHALRMYPLGSAWCAFQEDVLGSLQPGKYADMVVLSPLARAADPNAIKEIQPMLTVVGGRVVFDRDADSAASMPPIRVTGPLDAGCDCAGA